MITNYAMSEVCASCGSTFGLHGYAFPFTCANGMTCFVTWNKFVRTKESRTTDKGMKVLKARYVSSAGMFYLFSENGHWVMADYYEDVPSPTNLTPTVPEMKAAPIDEETRLRAILTAPSPDCCQKCGAPKSTCNYH